MSNPHRKPIEGLTDRAGRPGDASVEERLPGAPDGDVEGHAHVPILDEEQVVERGPEGESFRLRSPSGGGE